MTRRTNIQAGFTLVEAVITVAIIAIAAGVIIPSVANVSRADLRKSSSMFAALTREAYDSASLSGQTHRITLSFTSRTIKLESTSATLHFDQESGAFVEASKGGADASRLMAPTWLDMELPAGTSDEEAEDKSSDKPSTLQALGNINKLAEKTVSFTPVKTLNIDDDVKLLDVWTGGMSQPATEGEVYLMFFPSGYTQDALVHLEDSEGRAFTVKVWSLTGRTAIYDSYIEAPK